jgi:hypothetical protein
MGSTFIFFEPAKCICRTFQYKYVNTCNEISNVIIVLLYQTMLNSMRRVPNDVSVRLRQACIKENPEIFAERTADMSVITNTAYNVIKEVTDREVKQTF